ncbi:MAG: hypothetical protein N2117_00435 [Anaerolineales bacterium]|nr:hypothetical protein [Anaerolineales bacterium]
MESRPRFTLFGLLWFPIGVLLNMSPLTAAGLLLLSMTLCGFLYRSVNSDFWGLAAPPWTEFKFSENYRRVTTADGRSWEITYEKDTFSVFTGVAREVIHWRDEPEIPFATHDILITNGEYSSVSLVTARVRNHTVRYQWYTDRLPEGTINLLHIVPLNEEVYHHLLQIRRWNLVSIKGQEILRIESFNRQGALRLVFQDAGCNTILVTSVQILAQGTPVP